MLTALRKSLCQIHINYLVRKAAGGIKLAEVNIFFRRHSGFFKQFSFAGFERVFTLFYFSCREFEHNLHIWVAELPYKNKLVILCECGKHNAFCVLDNFSHAHFAVRKHRIVFSEIYDFSLINIILFYCFFFKIHTRTSTHFYFKFSAALRAYYFMAALSFRQTYHCLALRALFKDMSFSVFKHCFIHLYFSFKLRVFFGLNRIRVTLKIFIFNAI